MPKAAINEQSNASLTEYEIRADLKPEFGAIGGGYFELSRCVKADGLVTTPAGDSGFTEHRNDTFLCPSVTGSTYTRHDTRPDHFGYGVRHEGNQESSTSKRRANSTPIRVTMPVISALPMKKARLTSEMPKRRV